MRRRSASLLTKRTLRFGHRRNARHRSCRLTLTGGETLATRVTWVGRTVAHFDRVRPACDGGFAAWFTVWCGSGRRADRRPGIGYGLRSSGPVCRTRSGVKGDWEETLRERSALLDVRDRAEHAPRGRAGVDRPRPRSRPSPRGDEVDFPVDVALAELVPTLAVGAGRRYETKLWPGFQVVRCPGYRTWVLVSSRSLRSDLTCARHVSRSCRCSGGDVEAGSHLRVPRRPR